MDLKLNVSKKGLSTQEEVINEEYTLRYGYIFRGPKGDPGEKGEKGDNGKSPKVSNNGTWLVYSDETQAYVDTGIKASGSDNNYTDADKVLVQTIPSKLDRSEFEEFEGETAETLVSITQGIDSIAQDIETKANKRGYYPSMSVGMADNLVGRGDVQDAQISFRPSAGADNITDGAARIERIKGNSVVWNQRHSTPYTIDYTVLENATFTYYYGANVESYTYADGVATLVGKPNLLSGLSIASRVDVGHKMLTIAKIKCSVADLLMCKTKTSASDNKGSYISTDWNEYAIVLDAPSGDYRGGMSVVVAQAKQNSHDGYTCEIKDIQQIDLTQMFGAGNEPTTVEEYRSRKPMNIEDEFAYNAGTLVDMKVESLISTSDNAYDYTKGYARVMGGVPYTITVDNRNDITPEEVYFSDTLPVTTFEENIIYPNADGTYTFPSIGYAKASFQGYEVGKEETICICLKHTYEKPHPAYQQVVKDLSFISEAFPNSMRSAGSTFDEIRFNPTKKVWEKVERVGVRAYVEGDAENSSVTTDGKTTNYPLDNPTPTTIDLSPNFNPDYLVWDFGTEEAIASVPSAPFRADINYEPNSVDDLRWAVAKIRELTAQLAQQSQTTNIE